MTTYYDKYMKYKTKYNGIKNDMNNNIDIIINNSYNVYAIKNNMNDTDFENKINKIHKYIQVTKSKYNNQLETTIIKFIDKINSIEPQFRGPLIHV